MDFSNQKICEYQTSIHCKKGHPIPKICHWSHISIAYRRNCAESEPISILKWFGEIVIAILCNPKTVSAYQRPNEENHQKLKNIVSFEPYSHDIHVWSSKSVHLANSFRTVAFEFWSVKNHLKDHQRLSKSHNAKNVIYWMNLNCVGRAPIKIHFGLIVFEKRIRPQKKEKYFKT